MCRHTESISKQSKTAQMVLGSAENKSYNSANQSHNIKSAKIIRWLQHSTHLEINKNLAIANRSRVSYEHNTLRALKPVILKSRLRVTQGKRNHWIDHTRLSSSRVIWHWNVG